VERHRVWAFSQNLNAATISRVSAVKICKNALAEKREIIANAFQILEKCPNPDGATALLSSIQRIRIPSWTDSTRIVAQFPPVYSL
jgi:hypothetical protein